MRNTQRGRIIDGEKRLREQHPANKAIVTSLREVWQKSLPEADLKLLRRPDGATFIRILAELETAAIVFQAAKGDGCSDETAYALTVGPKAGAVGGDGVAAEKKKRPHLRDIGTLALLLSKSKKLDQGEMQVVDELGRATAAKDTAAIGAWPAKHKAWEGEFDASDWVKMYKSVLAHTAKVFRTP